MTVNIGDTFTELPPSLTRGKPAAYAAALDANPGKWVVLKKGKTVHTPSKAGAYAGCEFVTRTIDGERVLLGFKPVDGFAG